MNTKNKEIKTCVRCTPLVSIDLVVMDAEGKVLLGKRKNRPAQNLWFVPGGRILKNEPLREALSRISQNEIGIKIDHNEVRLAGAYDHMYEDNFFGEEFGTHYVALCCWYALPQSHLKESIEKAMLEQHEEVKWLAPPELLEDPHMHDHVKSYFTSECISKL